MKLITKLIRLEQNTIEDIKKLQSKILETEYISFSSLARKLIKLGLANWNK